MRADFELSDYYNIYINNAKNDIKEYSTKLKECEKVKLILYNRIIQNIGIIKESFNLDIFIYKEFYNKEYDDSNKLYNLIRKFLRVGEWSRNERLVLMFILRYIQTLKKEVEYKHYIEVASNRTKVTFKEYHQIVKQYYLQVHKAILEGKGYKFEKGLGILQINYWRRQFTNKFKVKIDFNKTNINRRALIAKGLKPFRIQEAREYASQGKQYDGVEYKVVRNDDNFYEITIERSYIFPRKTMEFQREEYIHSKLRGLSFQQMGMKYCKTLDDIVNLPVDIRVKLNILNFLFPNAYTNFIRNAERTKYKYRKDYSKD